MNSDNARDAAFSLDTAVRQLREYAILMENGIERPINLELAFNNIRGALTSLCISVTPLISPEEIHRRIVIARRAEAAAEASIKG